jgi:dephospho-CoA kinase
LRKRGDKEEVLQLRLSSEFEEFEQFYQNGDYDYLIANDGTLEDLYDKTNQFMTGE